MKKYNIIYADPAWKYNERSDKNRKCKSWFGGGVSNKYPTMTFEEIEKLDIPNISDKNCALFLWTTFPYLDKQIELFEKWGFKYKTVGFTWVKTNKKKLDKPYFGVGYYTKSNAEICLMGIKGKMKPISNKVSSVIISPISEHSKKPDIARNRIVELFGDIPRVELFARQKVEGWDAWGNEVESDCILS